MAVEIVMPKWGLSMQKGRINQWLKQEGDPVTAGDELLEVESDKITNVVEAPADGILARILYPAGSEVPITEVIAIITEPGEALPDRPAPAQTTPDPAEEPAPASAPALAPARAGKIRAMPAARRLAQEHGLDLAGIQGTGPNSIITRKDVEKALATAPSAPPARLRVMPAARRLAQEHGIDLHTIQGTGPNGTITRRDVEQALQAITVIQPLQKVHFFSDGHRLEGLLYTPENLQPGETRTGVVLCVGYTYLKELVMPEIAHALNAAGYVALVFDYRGFGTSAGPRWRLMPQEQIQDARAAVTFLADQPQVNPERLAMVGLSLGGSHAISAGALDSRIGAVVAIEAPGHGRRWLRSLRRYYEWQAFEARLAADRSHRVQTGESARVDPLEIIPPDPDSREFLQAVYQEFPQMQCELTLETAEALIEYEPEALIQRIAPRPVLLIHGAEDRLVPVDEAYYLFERAGTPKQLEVLPGIDHFNWVMPQDPRFQQITNHIIQFLEEYLPAS